MSTLWVDLSSGSDSTGDGSSVNPFLSINKAVAVGGSPVEIRVAKTPDPTEIVANVLWTLNSVSVSASTDLTSSLTVGDYIGKPTAAGNGSYETYYRVNNVTSTTITLEQKYFSPLLTTTEIVSSVKKANVITTGTATTTTYNIYLSANDITLNGGWDLALSAQNGETWLQPTGSRTANNNNSHGIYTFGNNPLISKINIVNCFAGIYLNKSPASTIQAYINNSTVHAYNIALYSANGVTNTQMYENNVFSSASTYCAYLNGSVVNTYFAYYKNMLFLGGTYANYYNYTYTSTYEDCTFFAQSGPNGIIGPSVYVTDKFIGNNKSYYTTGTWAMTLAANCTLDGFSFYNGGNGINVAGTNIVITNCNIETFTGTGMQTTDGAYSAYIYNCTFKACAGNAGFNNYRSHYCTVDNCYFENCSYGVRNFDQYSGPTLVKDCTFDNPTNFALYKGSGSLHIEAVNCSIDGASIAKAYSDASPSYYLNTQWIFKNSFGINGTFWGCGGVSQDYTNYRTTAPGLAISWNATTTRNNNPMKIMSTMINSGASATFNMYIKTAHASWVGTLLPVWRLNDSVLKTETQVLSTDLTTAWQLCSWSTSGVSVTADGELSLEFVPNMNTYSLYLDDFTVT